MKKLLMVVLCILILGTGWYRYTTTNDENQIIENVSKSAISSNKEDIAGAQDNNFNALKQSISKEAQAISKDIQTKFKLQAVKTAWEACDEENAWYDPETQLITFCDEMIQGFDEYAKTQENNSQARIVKNSSLFFYLHELGHAYIDLLGLPVTGKEEDVADQIATYFIASLKGDDAYTILLNGADMFYQYSEQNPDIDDEALADVHSLDKQRYYNILCRVYGATQDETIVDEYGLPEERAQGCEDEYNLMKDSLDALLVE